MPKISIRNVAIIAHVDHGKTTLVDALLRQSQTRLAKAIAGNECIMDTNELERERGITIFSKNASVMWKGTKINIIDTPGHADFGGEVERVLTMADGCLLLVDAKEGPQPQTRFVLKLALDMKHRVIVVINKLDRPDALPSMTLNRIFDLFMELNADDHLAEFPVVYAAGRRGVAGAEPDLGSMKDIAPVFEAILKHVPPPVADPGRPLQMRVSNITGDNFKGRIAIGRVSNGVLRNGQEVMHIDRDGKLAKHRLMALMTFQGLERVEVDEVVAGDIVAVAGIPEVNIGETLADVQDPVALPLLEIAPPTVKMTFCVNDSPFAGKEGVYSTSRQVRERLLRELETDMALRVEDSPQGDWIVSGRGELHLAILIERMRREGYEFQVSRPQVIDKIVNRKTLTPYERVFIEVPEASYGSVIQKLGSRNGELREMRMEDGMVYLEFLIPTRGLFGYRSEFIIDTRGLGLINTLFLEYRPDPGKWKERGQGSLVAYEAGETVLYGLLKVQDRGVLFLGPGIPVYKGQVVGQNSRSDDISVNVCKEKILTNMRSKGDGTAGHFNVPRTMGLEGALEYIGDDELVEVTPKNIRIRKKILDENEWRRRQVHGIK